MTNSARDAFDTALNREEGDLNLAYAALLIAEHLTEAFGTDIYLVVLTKIAENIWPKIKAAKTDLDRIQILNHYLFEELKFIGNTDNYYHPDNSFLNKVLDRRSGIPIALSVIYLEVGWSLGLPVFGVGLPGHFIVGYGAQKEPIFIDVFNQGKLLTIEDCLDICQLPLSDLDPFKRDYLKPVSKKAILFRMLHNLKRIYVTLEDWEKSYKTVDLMLQVQPDLPSEIRDRGLIAYRLGRLQTAIFDVKHYLVLSPDSADANWLQQHVRLMEDKLARLN